MEAEEDEKWRNLRRYLVKDQEVLPGCFLSRFFRFFLPPVFRFCLRFSPTSQNIPAARIAFLAFFYSLALVA